MQNKLPASNQFTIFKQLIKNSVRIVSMVWAERRGTVLVMMGLFVINALMPFLSDGAIALLINNLVVVAGTGEVSSYLFVLLFALGGLRLLQPVFRVLTDYVQKLFWFYLQAHFQIDILDKRGKIDVAIHENPKSNNLFNRVDENGVWRTRTFLERQFYLLQELLQVILAASVIIFIEPWVLLLIVVFTIPELIAEAKYGKQVWGIHSGKAEIRRRYDDLRQHFVQLPKLIELKLFQNHAYFLTEIRDLFYQFQSAEKKTEQAKLRMSLFARVVSSIAIVAATVWFVMDVVNGQLQIGTLTFALASVASLRRAMSGLFFSMAQQYQDSLFVTDIFKLLDMAPVVEMVPEPVLLDKDNVPSIRFENVSFHYPGTDRIILDDFSLEINPGDKLAIVGINGAGKTTLVKLLCRFYDPDAGRILINGKDLKTLDLSTWYEHLGIIFQDYAHYHFKVKDAIRIGRIEAPESKQRVEQAAIDGEAHEFIGQWQAGYEQMLGKAFTDGVEPSIGQWQKLALAKAFYRHPNVYVLDEPTASIDAEAEAKVFERLEEIAQDKTVILISHRFSTVRKANKIAVIDRGRLVELGSHETLLAADQRYARLFKLQAAGYQ